MNPFIAAHFQTDLYSLGTAAFTKLLLGWSGALREYSAFSSVPQLQVGSLVRVPLIFCSFITKHAAWDKIWTCPHQESIFIYLFIFLGYLRLKSHWSRITWGRLFNLLLRRSTGRSPPPPRELCWMCCCDCVCSALYNTGSLQICHLLFTLNMET